MTATVVTAAAREDLVVEHLEKPGTALLKARLPWWRRAWRQDGVRRAALLLVLAVIWEAYARRQHVESLVHHGADQPQRMIQEHPCLATHVAEQSPSLLVTAPHRRSPLPPQRITINRSRRKVFSSL